MSFERYNWTLAQFQIKTQFQYPWSSSLIVYFDLMKHVLKLVIDIYLELSTILKSPEELDGEQFEQFENELYVVKEWIR